MGGGGFSMEPDNPLLDDHVLDLARANRGRDRPRVCFLGTASGDSPAYIATFYAAFARRSEASHLPLFIRTLDDIEGFLLDQDVVYVGGGNTENMLAVWRVHGVDRALRTAWESGVIMTGLSAGSLCWFETGTTDSFGPALAALSGGLGFVAGQPRPALRRRGEPAAGLPAAHRRGRDPGRVRRRRRRRARLPRHGAGRGRRVAAGRPGVSGRARTGPVRRSRRSCRRATWAEEPRCGRRIRVPPPAAARVPRRRSRGPRPDPRSAPAGDAPSRRSRPSPAGRAPARGRPAARARRDGVAAARVRDHQELRRLRRVDLGVDRSRCGRALDGDAARPKTSRSRSSSRGPQRSRARRPNARSSTLSADSSAIEPRSGIRAGRDVERDHGVAELGLVGDADRLGRVEARDAAQARAGERGERPDRVGQRRLRIADVRSQADVRADPSFGHAPSIGSEPPAGGTAPARLDRCRRSPSESSTRSRIRRPGR